MLPLVLRTRRDRASHTANDGLGWADIGIACTGEGVNRPIDTEASDWAAGSGDMRDRQIVRDGRKGAVKGNWLRKLSICCTNKGYCDDVVAGNGC